MTDWKYPQEPNNDPRNAKYIVYDPHVDETYLCPTEEDALAIAQNALESNWPDEDKGIYIGHHRYPHPQSRHYARMGRRRRRRPRIPHRKNPTVDITSTVERTGNQPWSS